MTQILILYAHPAQQFSRMNRLLAEVAQRHASVFFNDLYHHYPNFLVDIEREQHLLQTHHTIVFQHPLYWYSTPAILKEWQDIVLQPGFAYGEGGEYLRGKRFT
ncbi:MAG: NAD(P)H-dependent oxidoreductase, partial [Gammaproteobacteria bacterium]